MPTGTGSARRCCRGGLPCVPLHYLDRTGERRAYHSTIGRGFALWAETVRDAVDFVERLPGVDPSGSASSAPRSAARSRVTVAADDRRVKAVVNYFGFLPEAVRENARRLPPMLVLHGARDAIVPVANAYALEALLQRLARPA